MSAPLDFDQRHKLALSLGYGLGKGEGPLLFGQRVFENVGVNLLYNVASGTPFTPARVYNEVSLAASQITPVGPINSRYGPWTSNLDVKATKGFAAGGLRFEAYVWVLNLLDMSNAIQVYQSSGSATATRWLDTEDGQAYLQTTAEAGQDGQFLYDLAQNNPNYYSNPRLVRFGLRANF
jgi:hypothetical protein